MRKGNFFTDTIDQIVTHGVKKGILHLYTEDPSFSGNKIFLKGRQVINFGSCSYLGLEFDPRLKEGAKKAVDQYGTQFSESRAYVSLKTYGELEHLLEAVFDAPCVVTPTTTLGHIAAIPVLVNDEDAVILDHQVHNSVQTATSLLKPRGIPVEIIRHSRLDLLEEKIQILKAKHPKIWYMCDGIYSMFGDACPIDGIYALMDQYPQLHLYVDDAHGMSVYGRHGRGSVLNGRYFHPRMVLATSLNKAFASGGGLVVFPDAESARRVGTCGSPLLSSGPMQPAALGAAIAAARIHLSDEIYDMQDELQDKIRYTHLLLEKYGLPVISRTGAAIFFIGVGLPKLGYNMVSRMLDRGFYVNLGIFPTVPMKHTGVRFTITRLHKFAQIEAMVCAMAEELPKALKEEQYSLRDIYKTFRLPMPEDIALDNAVSTVITQSLSLQLSHYNSIQETDRQEWDILFKSKGNFDWNGLLSLESCFTGNERPEENWLFDYVIVRNSRGQIVAATFLTTSLWKDDMLSPADISREIEEKRNENPYFFTSKVIAAGSLLTEGAHVYIDKSTGMWKEALQLIFEKVYALQEKYQADNIVLRDFHTVEEEMDRFMADQGFFRISMPDTYVVENMHWRNEEEFYRQLSSCSRQHFRKQVRRHADKYEVKIIDGPISKEEAAYFYRLYANVKNHSLELNTFPLPEKIFSILAAYPGWELLTLRIKETDNSMAENKPVCVVLSYCSGNTYVPMVIGMDYQYNAAFKVYRQALYRLVMRAKELGMEKIHFGFSAGIEKRKVGARAAAAYAYMQHKDLYAAEVLAGMNSNGNKAHGISES